MLDKFEDTFEVDTDFIRTYIDNEIGIVDLKDNVFEVAVDISIKEALFRILKAANDSNRIKALLILSNDSALGEVKNYEFWKRIIELRDQRKESGSYNVGDPNTETLKRINALSQYLSLMCRSEKLVISTVRGSVVGSFLGTILASDFRIAAEHTVFSFPHIQYNIPPLGGLGYFLQKFIGSKKAREILLYGKSISAPEAKDMGLIDYICPTDNFIEECLKIAHTLTDTSVRNIRVTKNLLNYGVKDIEKYCEIESQLFNVTQIKLPTERL